MPSVLLLLLLLPVSNAVSADVLGHARAIEGLPVGRQDLVDRYRSGLTTTSSVAAADFDGDGYQDLAVAFDTPGGPMLGLFRGRRPASFGQPQTPYEAAFRITPLPRRAEYLEAGDFNGDGLNDLIGARTGGDRIWLLPGQSGGEFGDARWRDAAGAIAALTSGNFGRLDDQTDLALSIHGSGLSILTSPEGAWHAPSRLVSKRVPTSLTLARLDQGSRHDLAAVSGRHVLVVRGEGGTDAFDLSEAASGITAGVFRGTTSLVVRTASGLVLLDAAALAPLAAARVEGGDNLLPIHVSGAPGPDLAIFGEGGLAYLQAASLDALPDLFPDENGSGIPELSPIRITDRPVRDVARARLNADALTDMVLAGSGRAPTAILSQPRRVFTVNSDGTMSDGDLDDGICDIGPDGDGNYTGECTLNAAVDQANSSAGADVINFALPGSGPFTLTGMDVLYGPTTVDATSQPGWSGTPLIFLPDQGLDLEAGNSAIRGVGIYSADPQWRPAFGVDMTKAGNNVLESSWIGVDPSGTVTDPDGTPSSGDELGMFAAGIWIRTSGNTIGGAAATARNVISGTLEGDGILISGAGATGNLVEGNYIGTDAAGQTALGNYLRGVSVSEQASSNTVRGNVVSGNGWLPDPSYTGAGIALQLGPIYVDPLTSVDGPPTGNLVVDNKVGTSADGSSAIPNVRGILVEGALDNTVGSTVDSLANVISGNTREGVKVSGLYDTTTGNVITGNTVGLDSAGSNALANGTDGVLVEYAGSNTVGGTTPGAGNLISGNASRGVAVVQSADVVVAGNFIGTDVTALIDRGNGSSGIQVASSTRTVIGTGTTDGRNVIAANGGGGLYISGSADATVVKGNYIGTDGTGEAGLANRFDGIRVIGGTGLLVGGTQPGEGNTIAFNEVNGIMVFNGSGFSFRGNSILDNGSLGIDLGNDGVTDNDAGDSDTGQNNLQNFPEIGWLDADRLRINLSGEPNTTYSVDLFASPACDESDYGEGKRFIGTLDVTTDALGEAETETTPILNDDEDYATATATAPDGSTSEFSRCAADLRLIVNTTGDAPDADPSDPTCDTGTEVLRNGEEEPECTLRAAIQQANANDGTDEITFDIIQGSAPHVIAIGFGLDSITGAVSVDARTQAGYAAGTPVVTLDGGGSVSTGLDVDSDDVLVAGLAIQNFASGIIAGSQGITLTDVALLSNSSRGMLVTGDTPGFDGTFATGLLRVENNGSASQPSCDSPAGISLGGDLTTEDLLVSGNCGHGIYTPGGTVTVNGNATVVDNGGLGFRVESAVLNGTEHEISRNGDRAIAGFTTQTGAITITGRARINDNGPVGQPECDDMGEAAVNAPTITTGDLEVLRNCHTGVWATEGNLTINGDATISNNRGVGLRALRNVIVTGTQHAFESNGGTGIAAFNGNVEISGTAEVRFNNTLKDAAECLAENEAGIYASQDILADDIRAHENCGAGLYASHDIRIAQQLRATSNTAAGVHASTGSIVLASGSHVASSNGGNGLEARGRVGLIRVTGTLTSSENDSSGVAARAVDLAATSGSACRNGRYGVDVGGSTLDLGGFVVCDNALGGVRSREEPTAGKAGLTGTITGATIVGNGGDGILFEGGEPFAVTGSNIFGNAGLAIRNLDASATIVANGNWWGDPSGPGDAVSGAVTVDTVQESPIATEDDDGDGVSNEVEALGPNDGDANSDGMPDAQQGTVASVPSATDGRRIVVETMDGSLLAMVRSRPNLATSLSDLLPGGMVDIRAASELPGGSVTLRLVFPDAPGFCTSLVGWIAPQAGEPEEVYVYSDAVIEGCAATITVEDGGPGDADLEAAGGIHLIAGLAGTVADASEPSPDVPGGLRLAAAFPNPASSLLTVQWEAGPAVQASLVVYDVLGRAVRTLVGGPGGGLRSQVLDVSQWPAGTYLIALQAGTERRTLPLLVVH